MTREKECADAVAIQGGRTIELISFSWQCGVGSGRVGTMEGRRWGSAERRVVCVELPSEGVPMSISRRVYRLVRSTLECSFRTLEGNRLGRRSLALCSGRALGQGDRRLRPRRTHCPASATIACVDCREACTNTHMHVCRGITVWPRKTYVAGNPRPTAVHGHTRPGLATPDKPGTCSDEKATGWLTGGRTKLGTAGKELATRAVTCALERGIGAAGTPTVQLFAVSRGNMDG